MPSGGGLLYNAWPTFAINDRSFCILIGSAAVDHFLSVPRNPSILLSHPGKGKVIHFSFPVNKEVQMQRIFIAHGTANLL